MSSVCTSIILGKYCGGFCGGGCGFFGWFFFLAIGQKGASSFCWYLSDLQRAQNGHLLIKRAAEVFSPSLRLFCPPRACRHPLELHPFVSGCAGSGRLGGKWNRYRLKAEREDAVAGSFPAVILFGALGFPRKRNIVWALTQPAACKDLEWQKKGRYFFMNAWNKVFFSF